MNQDLVVVFLTLPDLLNTRLLVADQVGVGSSTDPIRDNCEYIHESFFYHDNRCSSFLEIHFPFHSTLKNFDIANCRFGSYFEIIPETGPTNLMRAYIRVAGLYYRQ
jgi:hypothetical protein